METLSDVLYGNAEGCDLWTHWPSKDGSIDFPDVLIHRPPYRLSTPSTIVYDQII